MVPASWCWHPSRDRRLAAGNAAYLAPAGMGHAPVVVLVGAQGQIYARTARLSERIVSRLMGFRLDRALAAGAQPEDTAPLFLRARHLVSPTTRRTLARTLRRLLDEAQAQPVRRVTPPLIRGRRIAAARGELEALADKLLSPAPVAARGVAEAMLLLTDGTGPLHRSGSAEDLRAVAIAAAHDLDT